MEVPTILLEIAGESGRSVVDELVLTNLVGEVHIGQHGLSFGEADPLPQPDHDRKTARAVRSTVMPSFTHVRAEVGGSGIAMQGVDLDLMGRDTHHQRAEPFDERRDRVEPQRLTLSTEG